MKNKRKVIFVLLILISGLASVHAKLSQPDYVLYGTATWFGEPLPNNSEISIFINSQLLTVAKYSMGSDDNLNGLYALRVPMDDIDPRTQGTSRPGDPAMVYINGNLVAEILVGAYGVAERLDLDPLNLAGSTSVLNILPGEILEGDSGVSFLDLQIVQSQLSDEVVTVNWQTQDSSPTSAFAGDDCTGDFDYITNNGTATIAVGSLATSIQVEICGDTLIEQSENFEVNLSNPNNAVIQFPIAVATILDDDGQPELRGFDKVIFEPDTGSVTHDFQLKLSRIYEQNVIFNYTTVAGSASAGTDYVTTSGVYTIQAGEQFANISVEFLADGVAESIEVMTIAISNIQNAQLITPTLTGFIMDANREQQTKDPIEIDNTTVPELISPSDVKFSNNDKHVYVSSLNGEGSLLHFTFTRGTLALVSKVDNSTAGFEEALFKLIRQIVLSPNGKYLYAAASGNNAISIFAIDSSTGSLTFVNNFVEGIAGEFGIHEIYGLAVSDDGKNLYAAGSASDSVSAFSIDDSTGLITLIESEKDGVNDASDAGSPVAFMDRPIKVDVSADGKSVYVAANNSSSIIAFERDSSTGSLNYQESFRSGIANVTNLSGAANVLSSADGSHVYALGGVDNSVVMFNRSSDGSLTYNKALTKAVPDFIGLDLPSALITSPADDRVYALGFDDSTMVTFIRDNVSTSTNFGSLEFADLEQDEVGGVTKMNGPTSLDISHNSSWIIVAAGIDNALVVFETHIPESNELFSDGFE
jgi:6-phosphogluconolactonase (cycloisomerase 2 family)